MLAGFEGPKGLSQPDDNVPVYLVGFIKSKAPLCTLHYDVFSNYRNATRKHTQHRIFICKFEVWGFESMVTLEIRLEPCRLFQSCISNYSQQEKLEYSEYIFVTFTKFLLWVNLWYFGAWIRVAAHANCGRQTLRIQIRSLCYSSNLGDYIKTQGFISIKLL